MAEPVIGEHSSGGKKELKIERFDLIPPAALEQVAKVYGVGATKYAARNWEAGYPWGWSLAALHRHIKAFEKRESLDPESRCHHLASAVFHCLALMTFEQFQLGVDDRSKLGSETPNETPKV